MKVEQNILTFDARNVAGRWSQCRPSGQLQSGFVARRLEFFCNPVVALGLSTPLSLASVRLRAPLPREWLGYSSIRRQIKLDPAGSARTGASAGAGFTD
jgi:hypothetical protein